MSKIKQVLLFVLILTANIVIANIGRVEVSNLVVSKRMMLIGTI